MSLMHLLNSGKSLVKVNDSVTRYRMHKQYLLPKFGSPKNPFADAAKVDSDPPVERSDPRTRPPATVSGRKISGPNEPGRPSNSQKTSSKNSFGEGSRAGSPDLRGTTAPRPSPTRIWKPLLEKFARRLKTIGWGPKHRTPAIFSAKKIHKSPVQGELAWENIKVVRNDLSDADVEIVPLESSSSKPGAVPAPASYEKARPLETVWGRVTAGIFGQNAA
jgi:hypothetical protein